SGGSLLNAPCDACDRRARHSYGQLIRAAGSPEGEHWEDLHVHGHGEADAIGNATAGTRVDHGNLIEASEGRVNVNLVGLSQIQIAWNRHPVEQNIGGTV